MNADIIGNPAHLRKYQMSGYKPGNAVRQLTSMVQKDYAHGETLLHRPYNEFNRRSVIGEMNKNQKSFNTYVPPRSDDPDESWRAQTTRPIVRNKIISIAAHVTASIIYPSFFAQNPNDEEDRAAGEVMRLISEWIIHNSNYEMTFVNAILQALTDPATIVKPEFLKVMRTIKEEKERGKGWATKEVIDEVMSGFVYSLVNVRDLLISNIYENNIQKQRFLIHRKKIDYQEARALHQGKGNFQFVKPGYRILFSDHSDKFYEVEDRELEGNLVEEVTYYHRQSDLQLTFVGGVLIGDKNQPITRQDKLYPFAKSGYEPLNNGNFFYYKSAVNKLGPDEDLVNTLYNMILDGTFLQLMPPMALYGGEEVGASVMVPGTVTSFQNPDTKLDSLAPRQDIRAGLMATEMVERSITESSQENLRSGIASPKEMTAHEVQRLEVNAKTALGLFDKQVRFLVKDLGILMVGDVKQHMTMAEVNDLTSPEQRLAYQKFLLPEQVVNGQKLTQEIRFSDEDFGRDSVPNAELRQRSFDLLQKEGGPNGKRKIYQVNPMLFRNNKYKVIISADALEMKNKALERALNLEAYDRAIQNPVADQEAVTREFLFETLRPGESGRFMKKPEQMQQEQQQQLQQKGVNQNFTGQITRSNNLTAAASAN